MEKVTAGVCYNTNPISAMLDKKNQLWWMNMLLVIIVIAMIINYRKDKGFWKGILVMLLLGAYITGSGFNLKNTETN